MYERGTFTKWRLGSRGGNVQPATGSSVISAIYEMQYILLCNISSSRHLVFDDSTNHRVELGFLVDGPTDSLDSWLVCQQKLAIC